MLEVGDMLHCSDQEDMLWVIRNLRILGFKFRQTTEPCVLEITGVGEPNWVEAEKNDRRAEVKN